MIELALLIAIAYAGARGVERITGSDRSYDTPEARNTVTKVAATGPKNNRRARKPPGPTEPGGTFSAAAPRSAKVGGKVAYPLAIATETGSTMWKAIGEGYRERWPEIRAEHRRKMAAKAEARRQKKKTAAKAKKTAAEAAAKAGPPPAYPPKPAEPPTVGAPDAKHQPEGTSEVAERTIPARARTRVGPEIETTRPRFEPETLAPHPTDPEPLTGNRHLSVVPDLAQNGDLMSSPATVIPEIRTLDGLMNALALTKAMCEMRAEEALAVAADDKSLSDRLDQMEAELAELEVDDGTRGEIDALRELVHTQSQAAAQYGAAAKDAGDVAAATAAAAYKAHGGIAEAVQSSPIEVAAQAGYYEH